MKQYKVITCLCLLWDTQSSTGSKCFCRTVYILVGPNVQQSGNPTFIKLSRLQHVVYILVMVVQETAQTMILKLET